MKNNGELNAQLEQGFQNARMRWDIIWMFIGTTAVALVGVPLYGILYGFTASAWIAFGILFAACNLAITTGYHRLWSHKAFKAHWTIRLTLALIGALALENSILKWASDHRRHHGNVDNRYKDPYAATRGFWFSHMGWMLRDYPSAPLDFSNVRDLEKDPIVRWQHRYYLPLAVGINLAVPLALGLIGGNVLEMLLVAGFLRLVVTHHTTFFINSLAHIIGTRPWSTGNTARDNFILAILTFGEGYHNYHHAHPADYRNGIRFWQWDPTKWLIKSLSVVRLTSGLRTVSPARLSAGAGTPKASVTTSVTGNDGMGAPRRSRPAA